MMLLISLGTLMFAACSDDDYDDYADKEHDPTLFGEWVEDSDNNYVFDYYCFYSDGTGIHGSYESDIDWVNEDDDIHWYTVDDKFIFINGAKYAYSCDGSKFEIEIKGKTRRYYEK